MTNSNNPTCPKCHAAIPAEAPGGLCPKCALEAAATVSSRTTGGAKNPPPSIAEIAEHFPELEIIELLGAGGMGAVYKARQPQLDRFVALKVLSHELASDPAFVERFNREARVLARLSHPNIVGVHDFGIAGPYCFLTMEFVDGVNLRQAMQAGRFSPSEALAMVEHLCSALKFAHEEGVLHRDIKPENVLIDSKGRVKVVDFGIAKLVGDEPQSDVTLTMQGAVLGSPHYMAPEQIETPGDVDQRADIYSLGVVLYELLTGELPIGRFALPSEKAEMDARIDEIVMRTLEKEREARYQSAEDVRTSVAGLSKSHPPVPDVSPAKDGSFPRLGRALLPVICFVVVAAIVLGIAVQFIPEKKVYEDQFDAMKEAAMVEAMALGNMGPSGSSSTEEVDWTFGSPEVLLSTRIAYDTRADFRFAYREDPDSKPRYVPIGSLLGVEMPGQSTLARNLRDIESVVEIGTSGGDGQPGSRGISGRLDFTGVSGTLSLESGWNAWEFEPERRYVELNNPEKITFRIATRKVGGEVLETLELEINVSKY